MEYWARVTREGRFWLAEFPEAPGCQTFVEAKGDLREAAREAIEGWLKAELQGRRIPPRPRSHRGGEWLRVHIDPQLGVKVALRQAV
jgi:predicted RNase H-like HicB family nuclease